MDAKAHDLNFVLGQKQHWIVPVYQRHYEWDTEKDKQLPKLWEDLRENAIEHLENRTPYPHYFGAIIFSEPAKQAFGATPRRFLVDGQQRITTFQLILAALRENAREQDLERIVKITNTYLFNEKNEGMAEPESERFKLWPSAYDRLLFQNIVDSTPETLRTAHTPEFFYKNGKLKTGSVPKMLGAFWYLYETISNFIRERSEEDEVAEQILDALLAGCLSGFRIVVIQLDQNDDAQEIFASLNGLSKPLSPFDLIRNDVFHRARKVGEDDEKLFDEQWRFFENSFWSEHVRQGRLKRARADHLIAHMLVAETAHDVNVGKISTEYQHYARERSFDTVSDELAVLLKHAEAYRLMEEPESDTGLGNLARLLKIWDLSTFHPLVLWIKRYVAYTENRALLFNAIENYIVRREICGLTTKSYNKVVTGFIRAMQDANDPIDGFTQYLASSRGDISRMPSDAELTEACTRRSIYEDTPRPRLRYILQQLEYALRDKFDEVTVNTSNLTIEHVMPQKWSTYWPLNSGVKVLYESSHDALQAGELLEDEIKISIDERTRKIGTLGNLTLVTDAMNPSLSNAGWNIKKERIAGSLLALNRDIAKSDNWNEEVITRRSEQLARIAAKRWANIGTKPLSA